MAAPMDEVVRGFRDMAKGALISKRSNRERISPVYTSHLKPFSPALYYGMGVAVSQGWQFQNPFLDGYTGIAAYFIVGMLKSAFSRTPPLGQRWVTVLIFVQNRTPSVPCWLTSPNADRFQPPNV